MKDQIRTLSTLHATIEYLEDAARKYQEVYDQLLESPDRDFTLVATEKTAENALKAGVSFAERYSKQTK